MTRAKATPMIKQYLAIKDQYPDTILFYRMGDFYEMFFEDAERASRALEITLTSRNKNDEVPIPMCGVPFRAAQGYIARLIEQGFKVAICDQVEDPAAAKGLVKREVTRVITPGMIIENELLDAKSNNYILALARDKQRFGIAYFDLSTGGFRLAESDDLSVLTDECLRVAPAEMLLAEKVRTDPDFSAIVDRFGHIAVTYVEDRHFGLQRGRQRLLDQLKTRSLEGFGCEHRQAGIRAAGALVYYVRETQKQKIDHLLAIESYSLSNYLWVDDLSCRNLELLEGVRKGQKHGTLLSVLDRTVTAMGARRLKHWIRYPLKDPQAITARLDAVQEAQKRPGERREVRDAMKAVADLERLGSKVAMGQANARDLLALRRSLEALPLVCQPMNSWDSTLYHADYDLETLQSLGRLIADAIRQDAAPTLHEGGIINPQYDPQLDELVQISRDAKGYLARLAVKEKEATGIGSLKVKYNKVFGYYIEIPKTHQDAVPDHYVRKQTLVNAERFITDELKTFESKVLGAEEKRAALEFEIFTDIRGRVAAQNEPLQAAAAHVARLDCLLNLAEVADLNNYRRPDLNVDGVIDIEDGRHPVVEKMITGERFVPNSVYMDDAQHQILIITGPNMAGKSTVLRQVAVLVVMAQIGSFVPARKANLSITDRIFTRVGALDNLSQGQSTFMVEMEETANILNNATPASLIIMDEIGRGTSTFDGMSIAWAVAEHLHDLKDKGVKTLFATHYHELTELAQSKARIKNYNIAVKEWNDEIIFLRKLIEGGTNRSYGIQVARLAGIPDKVIRRSKKILSRIENNNDNKGLHFSVVPDTQSEPKQRQLSLFKPPENEVVRKLQQVEISTMTPLEALNLLHALKDKAKQLEG